MKWVSYTRSISSRIGEENPSNTIAEQNERIARYLKKCGCSVSEKYSDRRRTAEATEGFDKLVQDGMARKFDAVVVDSIFRCGRTLPFAIEALQRTFYPLGIQFAVVEDDFCSMRAFLLYDQRATKSDSQTVQYGFHLSYHPSENFLFDFIAVQEKTVNFGI